MVGLEAVKNQMERVRSTCQIQAGAKGAYTAHAGQSSQLNSFSKNPGFFTTGMSGSTIVWVSVLSTASLLFE